MNLFNFIRRSKSQLDTFSKVAAESDTFRATKRATEDVTKRAKEAVQSIDQKDVEQVAEKAKIAWLKFDKDAKMALLVGIVGYFIAEYLPIGSKIPPMIGVSIGGWYFISAKMSGAGKS